MSRHDHHVSWRALLVYGTFSLLVFVVGSAILYSYFEKGSLLSSIAPEPLPKVTVLTSDASSELAAAWVALLTRADFAPTLVTIERLDPSSKDFLFLCDVGEVDRALVNAIEDRVRRGGGLAIAGRAPLGILGIRTSIGEASGTIKFNEAASPLLARVNPGHELGSSARDVPLLDESPSMMVDARWAATARAAAAHFGHGEGRVLWFGFDPGALYVPGDRQLALMLKTGVRWASGQPISEGAIGEPAVARTFPPEARVAARAKKMAWTVDRLGRENVFSLRIVNRGREHLENPTVKFWVPPNTRSARLAGSPFLRRRVSLFEVADDRSVVISLPDLAPHQERIVKLRAIE